MPASAAPTTTFRSEGTHVFFRNLTVYRLPEGFAITPGALEVELAKRPLIEPTGLSLSSCGWLPHRDDALVYGDHPHLQVTFGVFTRLLPSAVLKLEAEKRAALVEQRMGFKPGKKQLREIKEQVMVDLLPRAFTRRSTTRACFDLAGGYLYIDTSSIPRADDLVALLRDTLGEFPALPLTSEQKMSGVLTNWVSARRAPGHFGLSDECQLAEPGDGRGTVQYLHHGIEGDDVHRHIKDGKIVKRVALTWKDQLAFVLTEKLQLKKVSFIGIVDEAPEAPDDVERQNFALMTATASAVLADVASAIELPKAA